MPPTPELTVTVLAEKLAEWCAQQKIAVPPVRIHYKKNVSGDGVVLGTYASDTATINLYVSSNALATAAGQRLLYVTRTLNETFLHELRHHWQFKTWSAEKIDSAFEGTYWRQKGEKDANEFAAAYRSSLVFLRVKRSSGGGNLTGFGRLAAVQKGTR